MLPQHDTEEVNVDKAKKPKMYSRRFPVKTMFLGVVARPVKHRNFDGKILLERIAKDKVITTATSHTNFTDDALCNKEIKNGSWRDHIIFENSTADDIIIYISEQYRLSEDK